MRNSVIDQIKKARQRYVMADTVVRSCEGFRADYLPTLSTWEAFGLLLILRTMIDQHMQDREIRLATLAQALDIPRSTLQRKLSHLKRIGAVEQSGGHYFVVPLFMNGPRMMVGYERRKIMWGEALSTITQLDLRYSHPETVA
jgi:IclR helix-turn-helix domain